MSPANDITFDEVWAAEFAPRVRDRLASIGARRSEAFLDCPLTVAGEEVRQMTPGDLLMLDGFGSPFVCSDRSSPVTADDVFFFLWQLHPTNSHTDTLLNAYRRGLVVGRLRRLNFDKVTEEIWDYCERMFADLAPPGDKPPAHAGETALQKSPTVYFLAPLLVSLASEIGHLDPMSGRLLSETPLPRLIQYQAATAPEKAKDDGFQRLRIDCVTRMNEINQARRLAPPLDSE